MRNPPDNVVHFKFELGANKVSFIKNLIDIGLC